jgi:hypothetical protein
MTNPTFDLTASEYLAARMLVQSCLDGMGGSHPRDLEHDEYTWTDVSDLYDNPYGWTKSQCQGFFGSLTAKGFVQEYDTDEYIVGTEAWRSMVPGWDLTETGGEFPIA